VAQQEPPAPRAPEVTSEDLRSLREEIERMRADYEGRIRELEEELAILRERGAGEPGSSFETAAQELARMPGPETYSLMGRLGQTSGFDRTFNPALGFVLDMAASAGTRDVSGDDLNRFDFRSLEVGLSSHIDPFGYAYAVLGAHGEGVEVEEAAGVLDRLPHNFELKGGKFLTDFGKFGSTHPHDLPFLRLPGGYRAFVGGDGNPAGTGLELHHYFGIGDDIPIRWSLGMFNDLEVHESDHEHESEDFRGKRKLDNFMYSGRATAVYDLSPSSWLQVGTSLIYLPENVEFHDEDDAIERFENRKTLTGLDFTYRWISLTEPRSLYLGTEFFYNRQSFVDEDSDSTSPERARSWYAWGEYFWNRFWSAGAKTDHYEYAADPDHDAWEHTAWVAWRLSEFNRLRLQYTFTDDDEEDFHAVYLQWTIYLGTHAHGVQW
jgi:hypothetical protein